MNNLYDIFQNAAAGRFPTADGIVELLARPVGATACVTAFTHHNFVAADVTDGWLDWAMDPADPGAALSPQFLLALAGETASQADTLDVVLAATSSSIDPVIALERVEPDNPHRRLQRALDYRTDVQAYSTEDGEGMLVLGRGLAGRIEVGIEVEPAARNKGVGLALARAAIDLCPVDEAVFVQVPPGNVASLRMVLAAGFKPVAAEVMFA